MSDGDRLDELVALDDEIADLRQRLGVVTVALDRLVKLSDHYGYLLNQYDGGERRQFGTGEDWIARLAEVDAGGGA